MAFNGSGTFVRLYNWVNDRAANIKVRADRNDAELDGFATGLSTCITKDGQTTITANLPMSNFKHTGVATGTNRTDYAALGQVQDSKANWVAAGGTVDAITATYSPAITTLVDGQECNIRTTGTNVSTTPTFAPNGLTARTIVKNGGTALVAGDMPLEAILRYTLASTRWELLNPIFPSALSVAPFIDSTAIIKGSVDATKLVRIEADGLTTGTTRVLTVQDASGTLAYLSDTSLVGEVRIYAGASEPTGWLFCYGQAISRSTYSSLFALIGTTYGAGDGSTTFNVPDIRGRVVAGQDDMGGTSANRLTGTSGGVDGDVLGGTGGAETHTLTTSEMPAHTHDTTGYQVLGGGGSLQNSASATSPTANTSSSTGGGNAHNNVQPTIILNYIIKT
jgi:microcystin-dependent protein